MAFVKKINTAPQLYKNQKGVRPFANQQYCLSTGNPSLDSLIGGGLPIGSIVLLLEDSFSHYHAHFVKNYLGEGVVNEHKCFIVDADSSYREREYWLKFFPGVVKLKSGSSSSGSSTAIQSDDGSASPNSDLKQEEEQKQSNSTQNPQLIVAWRYNTLLENKQHEGSISQQISYKFDNSREMGNTYSNSMSSQLKKDEMTVFMKYDTQNTNYIDLWEQVCEQVQNHLESENDDRIFRFLIPDFHLFLKNSASLSDDKSAVLKEQKDMIRFLRNLKSLIRATNGVLMIQVDEDLLSKFVYNNLFFEADLVVKLTSFQDHQEMIIGEYDGTLRFLKQPKLHGLICAPLAEFDVYALKLKGKQGIVVEKIHLEPEEDRSGQDENLQQRGKKVQTKGNSSSSSCGHSHGSTASVQCNPTKSHQLDF
eukprot:403343453